MKTPENFLREHRLLALYIDINNLVEVFTGEMVSSMGGNESSLRMIPTYIEAENEFLTGVSVLAIDAGGTNFRAALISINKHGLIDVREIVNYRMPGIDGEISAREFFATMADYVRPLASETQRIGFCFSYPTQILSNRDGRLIQFCKELQAPEVVGKLIEKTCLKPLACPIKRSLS